MYHMGESPGDLASCRFMAEERFCGMCYCSYNTCDFPTDWFTKGCAKYGG